MCFLWRKRDREEGEEMNGTKGQRGETEGMEGEGRELADLSSHVFVAVTDIYIGVISMYIGIVRTIFRSGSFYSTFLDEFQLVTT